MMKLSKSEHKYHKTVNVLTIDGVQRNGTVRNSGETDIITVIFDVKEGFPTNKEILEHIRDTYKVIKKTSGWVTKSQVWYEFVIEKHKDFKE